MPIVPSLPSLVTHSCFSLNLLSFANRHMGEQGSDYESQMPFESRGGGIPEKRTGPSEKGRLLTHSVDEESRGLKWKVIDRKQRVKDMLRAEEEESE